MIKKKKKKLKSSGVPRPGKQKEKKAPSQKKISLL